MENLTTFFASVAIASAAVLIILIVARLNEQDKKIMSLLNTITVISDDVERQKNKIRNIHHEIDDLDRKINTAFYPKVQAPEELPKTGVDIVVSECCGEGVMTRENGQKICEKCGRFTKKVGMYERAYNQIRAGIGDMSKHPNFIKSPYGFPEKDSTCS